MVLSIGKERRAGGAKQQALLLHISVAMPWRSVRCCHPPNPSQARARKQADPALALFTAPWMPFRRSRYCFPRTRRSESFRTPSMNIGTHSALATAHHIPEPLNPPLPLHVPIDSGAPPSWIRRAGGFLGTLVSAHWREKQCRSGWRRLAAARATGGSSTPLAREAQRPRRPGESAHKPYPKFRDKMTLRTPENTC